MLGFRTPCQCWASEVDVSDSRSPGLRSVTASVSDIGHVRVLNEDAILTGRSIFAVADGLGGHRGGEVASRLAVSSLAELDGMSTISTASIVDCLCRVNDEIQAFALTHPEVTGLGTTVAGVAAVSIDGTDHVAVFNVGDSRVYRLTEGVLARATVDHSEVEEMLLRGELSAAASREATNRHIITRSLGAPQAPKVDLWVMPLLREERFLVCSDGLTTELDDPEIEMILHAELDAQIAVQALLERALDAGGSDNISIVLVQIGPRGEDFEKASNRTVPREMVDHAMA